MDVYKFNINKDINDKDSFTNGSVLLLGKFETFHIGHQQLLKKAKTIQKTNNYKIGIMLINNKNNKNIQTIENRLINLYELKFDFAVVCDFNFEFKNIEGNLFINYLDRNFNVKYYLMGSDFRFGKDRKYDALAIKNLTSAKTINLDLLKENGIKISSSQIKQMHEFGEYNLIRKLVNKPLIFDIEIVNNLLVWNSTIIKPHSGNYYFKILINQFWYFGLINFSINNQINYLLINFDQNQIFDQKTKIKIIDIERIIINSRFDLINEKDKQKTINFFSSYH